MLNDFIYLLLHFMFFEGYEKKSDIDRITCLLTMLYSELIQRSSSHHSLQILYNVMIKNIHLKKFETSHIINFEKSFIFIMYHLFRFSVSILLNVNSHFLFIKENKQVRKHKSLCFVLYLFLYIYSFTFSYFISTNPNLIFSSCYHSLSIF